MCWADTHYGFQKFSHLEAPSSQRPWPLAPSIIWPWQQILTFSFTKEHITKPDPANQISLDILLREKQQLFGSWTGIFWNWKLKVIKNQFTSNWFINFTSWGTFGNYQASCICITHLRSLSFLFFHIPIIIDSKFEKAYLFGSGCHLNDSEMSRESMNYKSNMGCGVNISWYVKVSRIGLRSESMGFVGNDQCKRSTDW